ncbi:MAG: InlB B-repeat-containing protein [Salinivirgaceae bacterium]|nr:InlB B-repeat-containing protein [Salinivirgaceae bacterium]
MLRKIAAAFCLTMAMIATAEAQNSFAYQAVIRTAKGELVSNQKVGMKFSLIHDGEVVYSETHTPETNQYGNVQVEVGKGQNATGDFAKVPWNTMQVMMKIEADPNGGTNYIDLGTIQLQPAPYAMYAPVAGEVRTIQAGDPKSDSDALFEVKDKDGNVVFAVYPDGVRVFVNDEDTTGKAMPTGFAVSGRKAAKEGDDANIFAVNAAGTQVFVNDEDTVGGKAMPTGFAVSGRKAAKDGSDLFTVGSTGTQVYIDPDSYRDATKAISTGFAVSGRKAAKGENDKYLEINADGTRVYVDDADSDKPIQTGFAVSGRKAAKGEEKILEINAEGTKIYVGEDGKAVSTGFAVSGRKAAKGKEIKLFEVNSFGTQIYIDAQKDKAMSTGFAVSGRKAAKDGNRDKYMVIDADGTVIYVDYEEAKAMQTGFAVSGRKASKDGEQNTILKVDNAEGTRIYIDDVDGKAMQTGFAVSGRKASKDGEPNLLSVANGQGSITSKNLTMQDKESDKNLMAMTADVTSFSTPEFSVTDHNDSTLLSADTAGVGVHTELVVTGDVAQVEEFEELEEILPISMLVQKIDTIKIADSVPALYNANGYELLKMYGNGLFAPNQAVDVEGNNVLMFNAKGNLTKTQQDAAAAVLMIAPSTPNARLIIWPLKQANNLKISFGLMSAGDTTNRYVNVDAYINVAAAVECQVAVKSEVDTLGTVQFSGPKVYGAKLDLIPTPVEGYHFTKWSDGRVSNPRTVLILHDTAYSSANFEINTYNILATGEHGTVTVDGNQNADSTYNHGTRLTLKTHADAHYHFLKWSDGDRSTPRQLIIKRDTAFNAVFAIDSFPVTADAKNGKVTGTGIYPYNSEIELTAVADSFYHFLNWSDGSTDNPLKLTVDDEINMTAYFEIDSYTLTVSNPDEGEIEVKGSRNADWTYDHGTEVELTATAVEPHYHFDHWFDGSRNNPHKVTVKDNMMVTAVFMLDSCTVSTTASEGGTAVGGGTVEYGTVIELCAYPDTAAGYHFTNWSDGDNTNPRQLKVKKDAQLVANFSLNTYTVAYIIDGDVYGEAEEVAYGTPLTLRAAPVKEGYTFGGWSNAPATMPMHNVTITGTMPANKHTIKYKVDGADYQTVSNVEFGTRPRLAAAPEKDGYTFSGWQNVPATMPDEDITIEGTFAINRYTIAFNTNSGSAVDTIKADYGAAITAPAAPTREGYTFDGWDKALPETMPAQNLTLRAKWIINKYTITFDTDGGTAMAAMSVNYSKPVSEPAEPRKKGYTFVGWDSEIPAKMPAENLTIKALWKANQYTISFDANGGSSVASITADYGTAITKPANPTRLGYHFDGWDEELPATIPAENLTLKAQWTQLRYTVGVETANGTISGIGEYTYGQKVTLTAKPDAHYHFVNWGDGQTSKTVSFTVEKDTLLTANFAIDEFEIAFVSEGKTLQSDKLAFGATPKFSAETPTKTATAQYTYKFKEWSPAIEEVSQPTTYTAVFDSTLNQYTITYMVDGEVSGEVETYNYSETITIRTKPSKDGYTFAGWSNGKTTYNENTSFSMPASDVTLTAQWEPGTTTYKVQHLQQNEYDDEYVIAETENISGITKNQTNAQPKSYTGFTAQTYSQAEINANGSTIIEIRYNRNLHKVTYINGTDTYMTKENIRYGYYFGVDTTPSISNTGYTFAGWSDGTKVYKSFPNIGFEMPDADVTLTAQWTMNQHAVNFVVNDNAGGTVSVTAGGQTIESGSKLNYGTDVTLTAQSSEGYYFVGLINNEGQQVSNPISIVKDTNVTAVFMKDFESVDSLKYTLTSATTVSVRSGQYPPARKRIDIPETVTQRGFTFNVTAIEENAFNFFSHNNITTVTVPEGVTTIGKTAFSSCEKLTQISLPSTLTDLGDYAFQSCSSLQVVEIAEGNAAYLLVDSVLYNKDMTTLVLYPAALCDVSFTIPATVTHIGKCAFRDCKNLISVTFEGNNVTNIDDYAFYNCKFRNVTIPASVTKIGISAFANCTMATVTIPAGVQNIGYAAFANCGNLAEIAVASGNSCYTSNDGVLYSYYCDTLIQYPAGNMAENYSVADGVKVVGTQAFNGCQKLKSLTIAGEVRSIEDYVIANCPELLTVAIGNKVESMGMSMFSNCSKLTTVTIPRSVTHLGTASGGDAFSSWGSSVTVYCEADSKPGNWIISSLLSDDHFKYGCKYIKATTADASNGSVTIEGPDDAVVAADGSLWCPTTGSIATLTATPAEGYTFSQWSDGNTDNPRTVNVTESGTYTAVWQRVATLHVKAGAVEPYDGTYENPFATIADAVGVINGSTTDYTIIVDGTLTGNQTLGTSLDGKAQSITLCGTDNTADILDGGNSGTVLTVETSVPVVISNLKITNGNATTNGGGINIASNASVTLSDGALVEGNKASGNGGAVYVAGSLSMGGSVYIPEGEDGANDIYVVDDKLITIASTLDRAYVGTITPQSYPESYYVYPTVFQFAKDDGTNCVKFLVTPEQRNSKTYPWYTGKDGKITKQHCKINVPNDAAHPYVLTQDADYNYSDGQYYPEVYVGRDVEDATTERSYYITLRNFKRQTVDWCGGMGLGHNNIGITFNYYITLDGENNSIIGSNSHPFDYVGSGNGRLIFDATTSGSLSLTTSGDGYAYRVCSDITDNVTYEVAPGCTFSGQIGSTTYSDITAFFNAAKTVQSASFTVTRWTQSWMEKDGDHYYVDLGLTSGTKWATTNVGATSPQSYGDYIAWSETQPLYETLEPLTWKEGKDDGYTWANFPSSYTSPEGAEADDYNQLFTKYNSTDDILDPEDDAATSNWGSGWVTPTPAEARELIEECYWVWTTNYNGTGAKGYIVYKSVDKSKDYSVISSENKVSSRKHDSGYDYSPATDAHIFLPVGGRFTYKGISDASTLGLYMTASASGSNAQLLEFGSSYIQYGYGYPRRTGFPVRPVKRVYYYNVNDNRVEIKDPSMSYVIRGSQLWSGQVDIIAESDVATHDYDITLDNFTCDAYEWCSALQLNNYTEGTANFKITLVGETKLYAYNHSGLKVLGIGGTSNVVFDTKPGTEATLEFIDKYGGNSSLQVEGVTANFSLAEGCVFVSGKISKDEINIEYGGMEPDDPDPDDPDNPTYDSSAFDSIEMVDREDDDLFDSYSTFDAFISAARASSGTKLCILKIKRNN